MLRCPRQTKATDCNMRSGSSTLPHPQTPRHQWQMNAILATMQGRDSLIVQPTGRGKSLCYVSLCENKTVLVIFPTISLMYMVDQVQKLTKTGIRVALLGTEEKSIFFHNFSGHSALSRLSSGIVFLFDSLNSAKGARPEVKRADAVAAMENSWYKDHMYSAKRAARTVVALQSPFVCHCYMGKILRVCCLIRRRCEDTYSAA